MTPARVGFVHRPFFDPMIGRRGCQLRALDREREGERHIHTHPPSAQSIQLPVSLPDRLFPPSHYRRLPARPRIRHVGAADGAETRPEKDATPRPMITMMSRGILSKAPSKREGVTRSPFPSRNNWIALGSAAEGARDEAVWVSVMEARDVDDVWRR